MTDSNTGMIEQDAAPSVSEPVRHPRPTGGLARKPGKGSMHLRQVLTVGALIGVACWGAWVTKTIVTPAQPEGQLVKLQLQGLVTEYLQLQARSGNEDQVAAAATTRFMSELDKAVAAVGKSGRVVLVNEAVIGGDIPDITAQVKRAVYAKVPMPKVAVATPVQKDMQAYLSANGEHAAPVTSPLDPMGAAGGNPQ